MTAATTTTERPEYMLGDSQSERRRLVAQAALMEDEAGWLLGRLDVPVGGRVVDIGCGPVGILPQLSALVGPTGEVVGVDRHGDMLDHAARTCAELPNVRLELGDAVATELPRRSFDLAHIRLVLVNVPDPLAVLREAAAIVRPGGTVAVQEVDWLSWQCEPAHPAWTRLRTSSPACGTRETSIRSSAGASRRCSSWSGWSTCGRCPTPASTWSTTGTNG